MDTITELVKIDWISFIITIFFIMFAIKEIIEICSYFVKKFRIKTGMQEDKETLESRISKLEKHDKWQYEEISKISKGIDDIKIRLDKMDKEKKEETVATTRNQLYELHNKFTSRGSIDRSGLKTFLELGNIYEAAGGDDIYHDKLKPEIMKLPISGEDIDRGEYK